VFDLGRNQSDIMTTVQSSSITVEFEVALSDGGIPVNSPVWLAVMTRYFAGEEISILGKKFTLISSVADAVRLTLVKKKFSNIFRIFI